jgi:hypothetical protein
VTYLENRRRDAFQPRIADILCFGHLLFIIAIIDVGMKHDQGECQYVGVI